MGVYGDQVFPRVMNVVMNTRETRRIRERVCAPLHGEVLEIGFGTGHNLPFMPGTVTRLLAVDPLRKGRDLAARRIAAARFPVELVGLDGQHLPLPDGSADVGLSTWTMCSVPDPVAAIREIARVLRPGGTLHFAEHGLAPDEGVRRWQHRFDPVQRRMACGCTLTRDVPALIEEGGMSVRQVSAYYAEGEPRPLGWTYEGHATVA